MEPVQKVPWRFIAQGNPEFVQWIVATYGPLPELATQAEYERFAADYDKAMSR